MSVLLEFGPFGRHVIVAVQNTPLGVPLGIVTGLEPLPATPLVTPLGEKSQAAALAPPPVPVHPLVATFASHDQLIVAGCPTQAVIAIRLFG